MSAPVVLFNPQAADQLWRGFRTLNQLLASTLGPTQGRVLVQADNGPEPLTDAATIARRFLGLPSRAANPGAMLLRNLVWRVGQQVGDGSATAAVLATAMIEAARPYVSVGVNPTALRHGLEHASSTALSALASQTRAISSNDELTTLAQTITGLPDLSFILAEIYDVLGPNAAINIEDYVAPYLEREYHAGGRWQARLVSPYLFNDPVHQRAVSSEAAVALFVGSITEVAAIQPLLELLIQNDQRRLLLVAEQISGPALSTLVLNQQRAALQIIAVELRRPGQQRLHDFHDLAALTGAELLQATHGQQLEQISAAGLGLAQRIEATTDLLTVTGLQPPTLRVAIEQLCSQLYRTSLDAAAHTELQARLARLTGSSATLKLGASTATERQSLRQHAERAIRTLPLALEHGVVPGGGRALINCQPAVASLNLAGDAVYGAAILQRALAAPFLQIAHNAGRHDAAALLATAQRQGPTFGYDALQDQIVDLVASGILDPLPVVQTALRSAVSGAAMLLTTEALILKRNPSTSFEP